MSEPRWKAGFERQVAELHIVYSDFEPLIEAARAFMERSAPDSLIAPAITAWEDAHVDEGEYHRTIDLYWHNKLVDLEIEFEDDSANLSLQGIYANVYILTGVNKSARRQSSLFVIPNPRDIGESSPEEAALDGAFALTIKAAEEREDD